MPRSTRYGVPDKDTPEFTKERMLKAMRFSDLPAAMQKALAPKKTRGPQKAPTKKLISIRLSPDVLAAMRAQGRGWQKLADDTLRARFVNATKGNVTTHILPDLKA